MGAARICTLEGCGRESKIRRGMCETHYQRWAKYGDPNFVKLPMGPKGEPFEDRLVRIGWDVTTAGCWEWRGARDRGGYGTARGRDATTKVHRLAYEAWIGPIPDGLHVRHKCDNRPCVNPDHLELGTNRDNTMDRVERGRSASGEHNGRSKLDWERVRQIRALVGTTTFQAIADLVGVSQTAVREVAHNRTWREGGAL